jgi:stage II sporulation protein D
MHRSRFIICSCFFLSLLFLRIEAQPVHISLFNGLGLQTVVISPYRGSVSFYSGKRKLLNMYENQVAYLTVHGSIVQMRTSDGHLFKISKLSITPAGSDNLLKIKPVYPIYQGRIYQGLIEVDIAFGKLRIINTVSLDDYISGVVEAEGGQKATLEYYKTQALICRTYAFNHLGRHADEGFELCDGVHCQVYKGRSNGNPLIHIATKETSGLVIVDKDSMLINATFHSNCGGETANAEDVWLLNKSYLKGINDPYCVNQNNSIWEKTILLSDWKKYLSSVGFDINQLEDNKYAFKQYHRKVYYVAGRDSLLLKKLREDFKLKSTFFSVEVKNGLVKLVGHGYGHGVGLCQEGAMKMARLGYSYKEIVGFYYRGAFVINYTQNESLKKQWMN